MDTNTGAAPEAGGLSQAQESKLRSLGLTSDIIDDIRKANIPAHVLDKLDTISSPQQFATDIGMLWLPTGVTERIRSLGTAGMAGTPTMPTTSAPATPPHGYATPAATTPISDYRRRPGPTASAVVCSSSFSGRVPTGRIRSTAAGLSATATATGISAATAGVPATARVPAAAGIPTAVPARLSDGPTCEEVGGTCVGMDYRRHSAVFCYLHHRGLCSTG